MGRQYNLFARNHTLKRSLHSFKSQLTFQFKQHSSGSRGKLLNCKTYNRGEYFFITNICSPNNCHDQDDFIKTLSQQLMSKTDTSKVIISGDWNITLNRIDKLSGLPWKATSGRNTLIDHMEELNLTEIYRNLNSKSFNYVSKLLNLKLRIDYFLFHTRFFAMLDKFMFRLCQNITRSSQVLMLKVNLVEVHVYGNLMIHCWKIITIKD